MRYSVHLAQGHGIVWNIGESPVDGCTDFLFMAILALMIRLGLSAESESFIIGIFSHMATVAVVYYSVRKLHSSRYVFAVITAAIIAFGPALLYIASFWGTPFFAFFACLTWYFSLAQIYDKDSPWIPLAFASSALITGLIRPEGVFLSLFMLLAIIYINGIRESQRVILYYTGIFIVLGGLYFIWHWKHSVLPARGAQSLHVLFHVLQFSFSGDCSADPFLPGIAN